MDSLLTLRQVSVHYGTFCAAREVSLSLEEGQIGCLLGPSGCGKTTLLRAIAGFEPISTGDIVQHKLFGYRGVVIGADPTFDGDDEW